MMKTLFAFVILLLVTTAATATKVVLSGALTGNFETLRDAFFAINSGGGSGDITVTITDNIVETTQAVLQPTAYKVKVVPQGNRVVEGNFTTALILLNGADNVTFDGLSLTGANTLTFRNVNAAATANVILLLDATTGNTIQKCIIEGSSNSTSVSSGALVINVTTLGNSTNNVIDGNLIRPATTGGLTFGIVTGRSFTNSTSTISNTQIINNHIENVFINNSLQNTGILIRNNCINTLIKGNSVYNTLPYTNAIDGAFYFGIRVFSTGTLDGTGNTIDSNFFGGTLPGGAGGKMVISSPDNSLFITAIHLEENVTAAPSQVTENTIRNIDIAVANPTNFTVNPFIGIQVVAANLQRFENNTMGAATNNSVSIAMKSLGTGATGGFGFLIKTACANPVANNFIGGITIHATDEGMGTALPFFSCLDSRGIVSSMHIKNNTVGAATPGSITITNTSPALFAFYGVIHSNAAAAADIHIDSNTLRNITASNTGIEGISNIHTVTTTAAASVTLTGNTASGLVVSGSFSNTTAISCYTYSLVTDLVQTLVIRGNHVDNITAASGSDISLRGILTTNFSTSLNRTRGRIENNAVTGINCSTGGLNGLTRGISFSNDIVTGDSMVIALNTVSGITDGGAAISTNNLGNSTGILVAMNNSGTNGTAVVRDNIVHGIIASAAANAAIRVHGISVFGNATIIERNTIFDLQNAATSATARLEPVLLRSRTDDFNTALIVNNMVAVNTATTAQIAGIRLQDGTINANVYHNSILTEGSSTSNSYALFKESTAKADVKNNILYNAVTGAGTAFAIGLQTNSLGYTGNNNYLVSPDAASLAQLGAAAHTLASWQTATAQDAATQQGQSEVTTNAGDLFIDKGAANLLINITDATEPAKASNNGLALSTIVPSDFLNLLRSTTTPDIGAYEFIFSTLPVTMLSFTGSKQNNDAVLQWRTANEINVKHFVLQRSDDAVHFTAIGTVRPGGTLYSFTDAGVFNSKTTVYYRVQSVDADGTFTYSANIKLSGQSVIAVSVFPNPVTDVATISGLQQNGTIQIFNASGKLMQQQVVTAQTITINMGNYAKGMYLLQYQYSGGTSHQKIIKL